MNKKFILWSVIIVAFIVGISISLAQVDKGPELEDFNMDAHPGLEWIRVKKTDEDAKVHTGQWMTLEDVINLAEKKEDFSGADLWDYQYYAISSDKYYRIYEIADFDMLFELHVSWTMDEYEKHYRPDNYYYIDDMEVSEALLIAKDGLDTQVDIRTGDVEAYIKEHQDNPGYKKLGFLYFPAEVEGTQETTDKISKLIEDEETFIVSSPEEVVAIKIDSEEELYAFVDETKDNLTYSDKATGENMLYQMVLMTNIRIPEPQFLLYIPEGNATHKYSVIYMEKHGKDKLYITLKKEPRRKYEEAMKGCLIGLRILKDSDEPSTISEVTTIYIDVDD